MLREIKSSQRLARILSFKVTGTGTAAINQGSFDGTLVDNGTGDWTITFTKPFARAPICIATALAATGDIITCIKTATATAVNVVQFDATDGTTAKDGVFFLNVIGYDSVDET